MREIKFRVWHEGQMNPASIINNCAHIGMADELDFETSKAIVSLLDLDTPVMQYTGIKDKNGKEIYDNDILRKCGNNSIVLWDDNDAKFISVQVSDYILNYKVDEYIIWAASEIIGNIYENPELLK